MPRWFYSKKNKVRMLLYTRNQNHGNHNLDHFHVTCNNEESVFDINGNMLAGKCKLKKEISALIIRNRYHITESIEAIDNGEKIEEVEDEL